MGREGFTVFEAMNRWLLNGKHWSEWMRMGTYTTREAADRSIEFWKSQDVSMLNEYRVNEQWVDVKAKTQL